MANPSAVDLFAGAGGATMGLRQAGFDVLAAIENDAQAAQTYSLNHADVRVEMADIRTIDPALLRTALGIEVGQLDVLKACPPCQGFSSLARGDEDTERNDLVLDVVRFVDAFRPKALLFENVPGLARDARLEELRGRLTNLGYRSTTYMVDARDFGVPQRRKRFILLAVSAAVSEKLPAKLTDGLPPDFDCAPVTAGEALEAYAASPKLDADAADVARTSKPEVAARLAALPINGTRFDLPEEHQLDCHKRMTRPNGGAQKAATASYGRVRRDEAAPTMTTRCTTPACGAFVHPDQARGLTLREAAVFQTFPYNYRFAGNYGSIERQIGNAVPIRLAEALGLVVSGLVATSIVEAPLPDGMCAPHRRVGRALIDCARILTW